MFKVSYCDCLLSVVCHALSIVCCQQSLQEQGALWLSGRMFDSRLRGRGSEPHRHHCVVVLEQDTFILA